MKGWRMPVAPPKKSAAQQQAEYQNYLNFALGDAGRVDSAQIPGEYSNSARLQWAESTDGTKYPCSYILQGKDWKVVQADGGGHYWIVEGTIINCGAGATGSVRLKKA